MKTLAYLKSTSCMLALAGLLTAPLAAIAEDVQTTSVKTETTLPEDSGVKTDAKTHIVIKKIESPEAAVENASKDRAWLGLAFEEAPEILASQLGLDPGVGLAVTYVTQDSPAAKAGLQKNDVLFEFGGQPLVHPAQLRKLISMRKEGDVIKLGFYRAGKKETVSVTLSKAPANVWKIVDERAWSGDLKDLQRQIREMPVGEAIKEQMRALKESVSNARIDSKIQQDIRQNMEKARQAYEQAIKNAGDSNSALEPARKALAELAKAIGKLGENTAASLTAKTKNTTGESSETTIDSMVKTDASGTIMLLRSPKLHLTFHDKNAKLIFDGEIETPEQRDQVPREIWEKAEPLLKKMTPDVEKHEPKKSSAEAL